VDSINEVAQDPIATTYGLYYVDPVTDEMMIDLGDGVTRPVDLANAYVLTRQ